MNTILSENQCRVIGVLLEKETTTPEQYPLSLNALTNACNQKSNREPVLSLSEIEVQTVIDELMACHLVSDEGAFGGRVAKYSHRFCNTEFGSLQLTSQQRAIVCVLLLRGPQTPGELRTRTHRLADFSHVVDVENALTSLQALNDNQYVHKLAKEPGKRESRYAHLFSGEVSSEMTNEHVYPMEKVNEASCDTVISLNQLSSQHHVEPQNSQLTERVESLEQQVALLTARLDELLS